MAHSGNNDGKNPPTALATDPDEHSRLSELDRWELVNSCKTVDDLKAAVERLGIVRGSNDVHTSVSINHNINLVYSDDYPYNTLTRAYGIRQQLMYIMYYEGKIHLL